MVIRAKSKIKEWGNSFGVVIPKEVVIREGLRPNEGVVITITRDKGTLEDFFGKLGGEVEIDTQKMKDEGRKMWGME